MNHAGHWVKGQYQELGIGKAFYIWVQNAAELREHLKMMQCDPGWLEQLEVDGMPAALSWVWG